MSHKTGPRHLRFWIVALEAFGQSKTLRDDEALEALWKMPHSGAGRMSLFGVLHDAAVAEKYMYQASASKGWLEVTISHFD